MTDQKDDLAPDYIWAMRELGSDDMDAGTFCSFDDGGTKYIRSDLADARVALAIQQAADAAVDWYVSNGEADGLSVEDAIRALPHDPEALEALLRQARNEALDWAADQVKFTDRTTSRLDIAAAIRAMKGEV